MVCPRYSTEIIKRFIFLISAQLLCSNVYRCGMFFTKRIEKQLEFHLTLQAFVCIEINNGSAVHLS